MNTLDFSFEETALEAFVNSLEPGTSVPAGRFLAIAEGEEEEALEAALNTLEERSILLDISDLPRPAGTGEAALRLRREEQLVQKGLRTDELEETDPLRLYLEEVAMTPAAGDPQLLAEKSAAGDEGAMLRLTDLCLSRVIELAKAHTGRGVLLLDLIQEGSLGLWQAIRSWREGDFEAAADRWIRLYMARAITLQARNNGVGQKLRAAMEDYRSMDEQLLSELGRNPTLEEIAQRLHLTAENAATVRDMLENARSLAQAKREPDPQEDEQAQEQAVEDTAYFQMRQRIADLLSELDSQEASLLTLRYGLEGGVPLSLEDTGKRLGLTPDEVLAREAAALAKLRHQ